MYGDANTMTSQLVTPIPELVFENELYVEVNRG